MPHPHDFMYLTHSHQADGLNYSKCNICGWIKVDEIDRLRASISSLRGTLESQAEQLRKQVEENLKLRGALEEIRRIYGQLGSHYPALQNVLNKALGAPQRGTMPTESNEIEEKVFKPCQREQHDNCAKVNVFDPSSVCICQCHCKTCKGNGTIRMMVAQDSYNDERCPDCEPMSRKGAEIPAVTPDSGAAHPTNAGIRSCNRHFNCDKADEEYRAKNGKDPWYTFHCHDEDCEDCFGK